MHAGGLVLLLHRCSMLSLYCVRFVRFDVIFLLLIFSYKDRFPSKELRERLGIDDIAFGITTEQAALVWAYAAK